MKVHPHGVWEHPVQVIQPLPSWWAVGGGGSGAYGTVNSGGTSFTVTAGGSGYSSAPQIVISEEVALSGGDAHLEVMKV